MRTFLFHCALISCINLISLYYNTYYPLILSLILLIKVLSLSFKDGLLIIIINIVLVLLFQYKSIPPQIINKQFIVSKVQKKSYIISNQQGNAILYTDSKLTKGDKVKIDKPIKEVNSIENLNLFNYKDYLKTKNIFYEVKQKQVKIIYKQKDNTKTNKINSYYQYLFFQDSLEIDDSIKEALSQLAIIHLVVVSGFHFNIFYKILNVLLILIKPILVKKIISLLLLFIYLYLLDFNPPALRAFILLILRNNKYTSQIDNHNQIGLSILITLFLNPLNVISGSFQLTYIVSLIIINIPRELKSNTLLFNLIISIGTIPLISNMNYQISIFSFILSTIFTPIIIIFYLLIFLANNLMILNNITFSIIEQFETLIYELNSYNITINTGYINFITILIFYLIFFVFLIKYNKHFKYVIIPVICILLYSYLPTFSGIITYLNVGQGDCIIIKPPMSKSALMIDVAQSYKQQNVKKIIIPYLKSLKINNIEKLIITHDDKDHSGGKQDLIDNFKVEQVIEKKQKYIKFNKYLFVDLLANSKFKDKNKNSITL
ncbi:MAG: ComEC/Rec2 family competence protein, partial [Erysipelotrichales bacterium]